MPSAIRLVFHSAGIPKESTMQTISPRAHAIAIPIVSKENECPKADISES